MEKAFEELQLKDDFMFSVNVKNHRFFTSYLSSIADRVCDMQGYYYEKPEILQAFFGEGARHKNIPD